MHYMSFTDGELTAAAEPLREALAADLLISDTRSIAPVVGCAVCSPAST
jgi:hypothetical protein